MTTSPSTSLHALLISFAMGLFLQACAAPRTEVAVLGMIHGDHRTSDTYGIDELEAILRAADPDVVLTEIPPDRIEEAARQFAEDGRIEESRVVRFPEYTEVLFPLQAELGFEIVPCAAWTQEMAAQRQAQLAEYKQTRPEDSAAVEAGFAWIEATTAAEGLADEPHGIHTDRYDEIVNEGLRDYDERFNDDLGPGGWSHINAAHWALCSQALDSISGQGKRVVITFGAWHKPRLRAALQQRGDIVELDAGAIVERALGSQPLR